MRRVGCLASLFAMNGQGLVAALVGSVLMAVSVPLPAVAAAGVPCPVEKLSPPPQRPAKPKAPALDPSHARVGGDALATDGLAIPEGAKTPPKLTASTWVVADLDTGQVLGACDAHGYETPASVQKVLLAATMIPRLDPKQVVQVTREDLDIERGSSAVGLLDGGKYPIETLWYGLLFDSGNDAANVLARVGGGGKGRAGGVAEMNAEARHLGALQTHAVTPSGLDGPGQFTSAYDLVLIARAAFALPDFRKYVAARTAKIPPQPPKDPRGFQIQNDNGLLSKYPGALGGKSGFTTLARHSFVGAAKRGDRTLVAAVLGAEARPIRASEQTGVLLDWGFGLPAGASVGRLVEPGELDVKPTPSPAADDAAAAAAARPSNGIPGSSPAAVIGLTVAVAAVIAVMLVVGTRRRAVVRARRTALAERRASPTRARRPTTDDDDWLTDPRHPARPPSRTRPAPGAIPTVRGRPAAGGEPVGRGGPASGGGPGPRSGAAAGSEAAAWSGPASERDPTPRGGPRVPRGGSPSDRGPAPRGGSSSGRDPRGGASVPGVGSSSRGGQAPGGGRTPRQRPPADERLWRADDGERRVAGRGAVSGGVYRPADPEPYTPPRREDDHYAPPPRDGRGIPGARRPAEDRRPTPRGEGRRSGDYRPPPDDGWR